MNNNEYIASLFKPVAKTQSRKVWSIDLETVWLPFFTATNVSGITKISSDVLGYPVRLAYNADGTIKFNRNGKPSLKVAKEITDNVKLIRENIVINLQNYAHEVSTTHAEQYKAEVQKAQKAAKPLIDYDRQSLKNAMDNMVLQAVKHAEEQEQKQKHAEPVKA